MRVIEAPYLLLSACRWHVPVDHGGAASNARRETRPLQALRDAGRQFSRFAVVRIEFRERKEVLSTGVNQLRIAGVRLEDVGIGQRRTQKIDCVVNGMSAGRAIAVEV